MASLLIGCVLIKGLRPYRHRIALVNNPVASFLLLWGGVIRQGVASSESRCRLRPPLGYACRLPAAPAHCPPSKGVDPSSFCPGLGRGPAWPAPPFLVDPPRLLSGCRFRPCPPLTWPFPPGCGPPPKNPPSFEKNPLTPGRGGSRLLSCAIGDAESGRPGRAPARTFTTGYCETNGFKSDGKPVDRPSSEGRVELLFFSESNLLFNGEFDPGSG